MTTLADFQDAFDRALRTAVPDRNVPVELGDLVHQPGFQVYRNTVHKACIDALQANFPSVVRVVGEEWFRAAAREYVCMEWPREPSLAIYGATFSKFLQDFAPAQEIPWLAAVAAIDRCWSESHVAADAPLLEAGAVADLEVELSSLRFVPHPAARWRWDAQWPIHALWGHQRSDATQSHAIDWQGEGVLVTRPLGAVRVERLVRGGVAFLDACRAGDDAASAVQQAFACEPDLDLSNLIRQLLLAGAFTALQPVLITEAR